VAHVLRVRVQVLAGVKERVEASDKTIASWAEDKPWIKEEDTKDVAEKVRGVGLLRALLPAMWFVADRHRCFAADTPCHAVPCCAVLWCVPQVEAFKKWLKEQEEAQGKKKATEEPAFMSGGVSLLFLSGSLPARSC
jgi:hypothetical protein